MTDTSDKQINYNDNLYKRFKPDYNICYHSAMYLVSTFSKNIKEYKLEIEKGLLHDVGHIDITRLKYSISYFFVVVSQILGRKKSSGRNRIVQS